MEEEGGLSRAAQAVSDDILGLRSAMRMRTELHLLLPVRSCLRLLQEEKQGLQFYFVVIT